MNFCHVLKTNGVQTELQTDRQTNRVSCRGASLLKITFLEEMSPLQDNLLFFADMSAKNVFFFGRLP